MLFAKNVGGADRIIRIVLGVVIIGAGVFYGSLWGVLGLVVLATGVFRWCGLYTLLGVSTCKIEPVSGGGSTDSASQG
jgi:predicted phage tail protein